MSEREFCEKHRDWYVPSTGPGDPNAVPCPGCVVEAEAHWSLCEDQNIRVMLDLDRKQPSQRWADPEAVHCPECGRKLRRSLRYPRP